MNKKEIKIIHGILQLLMNIVGEVKMYGISKDSYRKDIYKLKRELDNIDKLFKE
jgi:ABC-type Fe2+-enterobactin transport system substrate-binding protein